ncbi:tRNA pseudouridine synthase D [gamma proteobacterium HTCC5015]|nr:tRNA pseudouridine synthase D [gamma proteobacterium HTCC5015]
MNYQHEQLARYFGKPVGTAVFKESPEDFVVEEQLSFVPSGEGEHHLLWIEKRNANTGYVAQQLARHLGVHPKHVTWAGLKDRFAVTRQWFSVHLPGVSELEALPDVDGYRVLKTTKNDRKLRIGANRGNAFQITLRNCQGEREAIEYRLQGIREEGVPNYFGLQRFGRGLSNLQRAQAHLIEGKRLKKNDRSMALSALRSAVFNQLLSQVIEMDCWSTVDVGDTLMLAGSHSVFQATDSDLASVRQRVAEGDCAATLPLVGEVGTSSLSELEQSLLTGYEPWIEALGHQRVKMARRPRSLRPAKLSWQWLGEDVLTLHFELPSGAFATSVLREIVEADGV